MTTVIDKRPAESEDRAVRAVMARLEKLSKDQIADLQELIDLFRDACGKKERLEVAKAIAELLTPKDLTDTVDPTEAILPETRQKLREYQVKVGMAIRSRRESLDMTQEELAEKAQIQQPHLSRLEKGMHRATGRTMRRIAAALKTKPASLDPGYDV